jgi:hypothetical protein
MAHILKVRKHNPAEAEPLYSSQMRDHGWQETQHLEPWIIAHPEVLDPTLKIVTTQFSRWASDEGIAQDRLDVLALSSAGELVVIELKRGADPRVHLQALTYAALVSGFTREDLAKAHQNWLHHRGDTTATFESAQQALEAHVEVEWLEEVFQLPRIILVAEFFPPQVITTIQWLSCVASDITIEAHEYNLFDRGDEVDVAFQRIFPINDLEERRLRPNLGERAAEVREKVSSNRRRVRSVALIHQAGAIPDGALIELQLKNLGKSEVLDAVYSWLDEDPQRREVYWQSHPNKPLIWKAADDPTEPWSATNLRDAIFAQVFGEGVSFTFSAADAWSYESRCFYQIAQDCVTLETQ